MLVLLEAQASSAGEMVKTAIGDLSAQAATVIPAALGLAVLVFGVRYLWRVFKKTSS